MVWVKDLVAELLKLPQDAILVEYLDADYYSVIEVIEADLVNLERTKLNRKTLYHGEKGDMKCIELKLT